ncbi:MAG: hypothetical protein ACPGTO_11910, partial [Polaribacter sp.]
PISHYKCKIMLALKIVTTITLFSLIVLIVSYSPVFPELQIKREGIRKARRKLRYFDEIRQLKQKPKGKGKGLEKKVWAMSESEYLHWFHGSISYNPDAQKWFIKKMGYEFGFTKDELISTMEKGGRKLKAKKAAKKAKRKTAAMATTPATSWEVSPTLPTSRAKKSHFSS